MPTENTRFETYYLKYSTIKNSAAITRTISYDGNIKALTVLKLL